MTYDEYKTKNEKDYYDEKLLEETFTPKIEKDLHNSWRILFKNKNFEENTNKKEIKCYDNVLPKKNKTKKKPLKKTDKNIEWSGI